MLIFTWQVAVDNLSLVVQPGEVLGLLGPNGAGKTTAISVLTAERAPTLGKVSGARVLLRWRSHRGSLVTVFTYRMIRNNGIEWRTYQIAPNAASCLVEINQLPLHGWMANLPGDSCDYMFVHQVAWLGDSEGMFLLFSSQVATPFITERQARKLWMLTFLVYGLIWRGMKLEFQWQILYLFDHSQDTAELRFKSRVVSMLRRIINMLQL